MIVDINIRKMKTRTKAQLRKIADKLFSVWIRLRDRVDGQTECYTCGRRASYKSMQNGHFVPRQYLSVRYDEMNCHAQCYACNVLYNGQPSSYAKRLEEDYGSGTVELLESKRKETCHDFNYQEIIDIYTEKLEKLGWNTKIGDWNI